MKRIEVLAQALEYLQSQLDSVRLEVVSTNRDMKLLNESVINMITTLKRIIAKGS